MKHLFFVYVLLLVALCCLASCYTQKYTIGDGARTTPGNKVSKGWDLHYIGGVVGKGHVQANCPSGNGTVITTQTALNLVVKALTLDIVAPSTTTVWCEEKKAP